MPINLVLRMLLRMLHTVQNSLEACIVCTATGAARNRMTDANIHLGTTITILEELSK